MKTKKLLAIILTFIMLLSAFCFSSAAAEVTRILAGSDFQHPDGNAAGQKTVDAIINAIKADGIESADGFLFCGDYDHDLTTLPIPTSRGVKALTESVNKLVPADAPHVYVEGNHDSAIGTAGLSQSGNNDPESGAYGVFVINEDNYMWMSLSGNVVKNTAAALRLYLNEKITEGYKAPVFVLSHVPLHYSYRTRQDGDAIYAKYLFDVLNEAGAKGLNIFFLFGHDHSSGWDDYIGGASVCLEKGDSINIAKKGKRFSWETETLNFTYMNAGYTGYYNNENGADDALTMSLFTITEDSVTIDRYSADGKHDLKSKGVTNAHKNEKGYAPDTSVKSSGLTVTLTEVNDTTPIQGSEKDLFTKIIHVFFNLFEGFMNIIC